jgi:uncharacterized protein DUF3467
MRRNGLRAGASVSLRWNGVCYDAKRYTYGAGQLPCGERANTTSDEMSDPGDDGKPALRGGRYANVFQVGHNAFEFVIDFGQQYGQDEEARFHTRIITNPAHVQPLIDTLSDSLAHYRRQYGDPPEQS